MKTAESVLEMVTELKPRHKSRNRTGMLVDLGPQSVPWSSIAGFSTRRSGLNQSSCFA